MKFVGLIFVFLSCTVGGFLSCGIYRRSCEELNSFLLLLRYIKEQVSQYKSRQKTIFLTFENEVLERNGFLPALREENICDEKSLLFHALDKFKEKLSLNKDSVEILLDYSKDLGRRSLMDECFALDDTINKLEEIYKKEKEESASRVKLNRSMGCVIGAAIVLVLL